ncbi:holin [Lacticaseibacillus rhamnosus]|uniref:Holin n=2 Tax=Lacticaseibacillus rhamnosus TaxID=47715 RepID=A0A807RIG0_LACRH|nr:putative holin-like toxin [Lacticaseibacillus rhamnosus]OFQ52340.1 holin [Lactobacillus sp. HMSC073B09]AON64162.1 holin [Lacticaseibacillus rhamnosus]AQG73137.1 holin [Lacticaseibacillus rhamnosus]AQY35768.1 holin [Lacticaseibacillus rhamnosus]ART95984.1 holin [Lacticaseibacillus rhamnosus]
MSVADALMLMLVFGDFLLSLIALIITIMLIIQDNQKDRR